MKTLRKAMYCSRCGDLLSDHEKQHIGSGTLCAFCEQMRSEALEIYQQRLKNKGDAPRLRLI